MSKKVQEPPMKSKRRKKKKKKMRIVLILEILFILILAAVAFFIVQLQKIQTNSAIAENITMNPVNDPNMDDYINLAVYGVDSRANDLQKNTRSDSIMIVSINKKTKDVKIASIFRDTYSSIQDHGFTKINHAYAYGGPELSINTINRNFDLNITNFVTVNFSALTNVIDLLGGIELNIEEDELKYVNDYTRDVARINGMDYTYIKSPGKQTVTGVQATGYCRVRYTAGGDFTRAKRQRTVLEAILKKAKHSNPVTLYKVANEMLPQIYTSLNTSDMLKLSASIFRYNIVENDGFPFDNRTGKINGASVVIPTTLTENVTELHRFLFGTENYEPTDTVKTISNQIPS